MYIAATSQISLQKPLSEEWLTDALPYSSGFHRALEADYAKYIAPMVARRMSPVVKRAITTALDALSQTDIKKPDAIIAGTGLGCLENSENFLSSLITNGEHLLQPSHFIQSTHNTISSQIALALQCNGYNSTYVHRGTSFESALWDAFLQFELNQLDSALIGGFDELTPHYFELLRRIHFWQDPAFAGEGCTSFVATKHKTNNSLCKISNVSIFSNAGDMDEEIKGCCKDKKIEGLVVGSSGDLRWDKMYADFALKYGENIPVFSFKNLCGEYFTASAFGLYAAIQYLRHEKLSNMLFYNHFQNINHALIFIEKC